MPDDGVAFYLADGGVNAALPGSRLLETQTARASNVGFKGEFLTTRPGCRLLPLEGDTLEFYREENTQGAIFFNPAEGQGAIVYGRDESMIVQAVGGHKFALHFEGTLLDGKCRVEDVSNGYITDGDLHLVVLNQAETYLLGQDYVSTCFIWDGSNPATLSGGYNEVDRERSEIPNAGGVMAYVHGRHTTVINARVILVGNLVASQFTTTAEDVLRYTEAVYQATAQYFSPPTRGGDITAMCILPIKDEAHGHGELIVFEEDAIFSINLNVFPRDSWANTPMVKVAYIGGGATGPYAVDSVDGDLFFRSQAGVQTLRSARAESSLVGSPQQPLSDPVQTFFDGDTPFLLRFACVTSWPMERRVFFTSYPIVSGRWRWHRGIVSMALDPVPTRRTEHAWEGMWTVPFEAGGIVQTVCGRFNSRHRMFALCHNAAGQNSIAEFIPELTHDVLEDGTKRRIRCQVMTRRMDSQRPFVRKNFQRGSLFLSNIVGRVDFGVWFRPFGTRKWIFWQSGFVDNSDPCGCEVICGPFPNDHEAPLGSLPDNSGETTSRYVQFLIRWAGYCSMEALRIIFGTSSSDEPPFEADRLSHRISADKAGFADYSDYEYAEIEEAKSWLSQLPKKP